MPREDTRGARGVQATLATDASEDAPPLEWRPGWSAGRFVSSSSPLSAQGQVLVCNVLFAVRRLPSAVQQAIAEGLGQRGRTVSASLRAASGLLGLAASRVHRAVAALREVGFVPGESAGTPLGPQAETSKGRHGPSEQEQRNTMQTLVRAALANTGSSQREFVRFLGRLSREGVSVGNKYHTKEFALEARFLAARCLQHHDAVDLRSPLGGLGIRGSLALLIDGVPLGGISLYGRHGSVTAICASFVSPHTSRLHARLLTWSVQKAGHGGQATAVDVLDALESGPWQLSRQSLRRCLSAVGGDGAVVRGGRRTQPARNATWRIAGSLLQAVAARDGATTSS